MKLTVSPTVFIDEWKQCYLDPDRDKGELFTLLTPFFAHWKALLSEPSYTKDVQYYALLRLLQSDFDDSLDVVALYVQWCEENFSVEEDLSFLFLKRLAYFGFASEAVEPARMEYIIARDFMLYLRNRIRGVYRKEGLKDTAFAILYNSEERFDCDYHPDYLLLAGIELDPWRLMLLHYRLSGYGIVQTQDLTHMPRPTIYYEGREAWRELKRISQMIQISPISKP